MEGNVNLNPNNYDNNYVDESFIVNDKVKKTTFYSRVFLYFGLGLLITAAVTIGLSVIYSHFLSFEQGLVFYSVTAVVSLIVMVILNFVMLSRLSRVDGKSIMGPFVTYAVMYGFLFGAVAGLLSDPMIIGVALGMTSLLFLGLCGIGYLTHNKMGGVLKALSVITLTVFLLLLVNLVLLPFALFGGNYEVYFANAVTYWLIEFGFLAIFILYTVIDFARIRHIAESGIAKHSSNVALYCAFTIYTDFIALFTYILRFLLIFLANRDN